MKLLLMLGALSAAIIFVGCGTAVGRATGVSDSKGSATLAAPNFGEPKAAAIDEEMVRALISDEIKKSRPMFEAMVVEEITDSQFQVEELGLMLQELRTQLEAVRELEPILSDIPGINSRVQGLQRSIIEAERVIEEIQNSNDGFQTSIQGAHDLFEEYVSGNIAELSILIQGMNLHEDPVSGTRALTCLSDVVCLAALDAFTAHAENRFEGDPFEVEALYSQLDSDGWDLNMLPEHHRFAVLLYRTYAQIRSDLPCYVDDDCITFINRLVYLVWELEELEIENADPNSDRGILQWEYLEELRSIAWWFAQGYSYEWEFENGSRLSTETPNKILFSPGHIDMIRRAHQLQPLAEWDIITRANIR